MCYSKSYCKACYYSHIHHIHYNILICVEFAFVFPTSLTYELTANKERRAHPFSMDACMHPKAILLLAAKSPTCPAAAKISATKTPTISQEEFHARADILNVETVAMGYTFFITSRSPSLRNPRNFSPISTALLLCVKCEVKETWIFLIVY